MIGAGDDVHLSPTLFPSAALREFAAHPIFYPVLASVLALATVGLYLGVRSRKRKRGRRTRANSNKNNTTNEPTPPTILSTQPPPVQKVKEEKQKVKEERQKVTEEKQKVEQENNQIKAEENGGEAGGTSGSDGNNPNGARNNNTPAKPRTPSKRKPKVAPIIYTKSKAKNKATKVGEQQGEGEAEEVGAEKVEAVEKPPKSVRIITEDGITKIGKLEITQTILGIYSKKEKKIDETNKMQIGYGSGGTIVFEGVLHGRRVAVKRMLAQFTDLAQQEISCYSFVFFLLLCFFVACFLFCSFLNFVLYCCPVCFTLI